MIKGSRRTLFLIQQKWGPALRGVPVTNYVNGEWVQGNGRTVLEVADPSEGSIFSFGGGEKIQPFTQPSEVNSVVEGAKEAAARWQQDFPLAAKLQAVTALGSELRAELPKLALFTALNAGIPLAAAKVTTSCAARRCEDIAAVSSPATGEGKSRDAANAHSPSGVSCIATGPSFPLEDFIEKALEAVMGQQRAVVWFPSPLTPLPALHLTTIIRRLESSELVPRGLLNVIFASSIRDPLLPTWFRHSDLAYFSWAPVASTQELASSLQFFNIEPHGSEEMGASRSAGTSTKKTLEFPLYPLNQLVCEAEGLSASAASEAVIQKIIRMVKSRGRFGLESVPKIVWVPRQLAVEFAVGLANALSTLVMGHALDPAAEVGPLCSGAQGDVYREVLKESCDRYGVDVVAGGFSPSFSYAGCYFSPTVTFVENIAAPILKHRGPLTISVVPYDDIRNIPTLSKSHPIVVGDWTANPLDVSTIIRCGLTSPTLSSSTTGVNEGRDRFWSYLTSSGAESSFSKQCQELSRKLPDETSRST